SPAPAPAFRLTKEERVFYSEEQQSFLAYGQARARLAALERTAAHREPPDHRPVKRRRTASNRHHWESNPGRGDSGGAASARARSRARGGRRRAGPRRPPRGGHAGAGG